MSKILILSQQGDPHTDAVVRAINSLSAHHEVVVFERYRNDHFIDISTENKFVPCIRVNDTVIELSDQSITGIYWRVKPYYAGEIAAAGGTWSEIFCASEWKHTLHSIFYLSKQLNWINNVECNLRLSYKPYQLKLAYECGLTLPETSITNYQPGLLAFYDRVASIIYKPVNSASTATKPIFTNVVEKAHLLNSAEQIAMAPGIFQKHVIKDHELRVTIVGEKVFVAKINSQKNADSIVDWRRADFNESVFELGELSMNTQEKLLNFHRQSGLTYGAYDFIVDTEGNEVFLECNPCGQWLWLEDMIEEYNVSREMATRLIAGV